MLITPGAGEDMEQQELLFIYGEKAKKFSHVGSGFPKM